jgi:hypothetical protein
VVGRGIEELNKEVPGEVHRVRSRDAGRNAELWGGCRMAGETHAGSPLAVVGLRLQHCSVFGSSLLAIGADQVLVTSKLLATVHFQDPYLPYHPSFCGDCSRSALLILVSHAKCKIDFLLAFFLDLCFQPSASLFKSHRLVLEW